MHGLNTYDYGARQYNPVTARWDRIDPLCEKYYSVSPYVCCFGDPINYKDFEGLRPGSFFVSVDDAARDFGSIYNSLSIIKRREYGSAIFPIYKNGKRGYTYTVPIKGSEDFTFFSEPILGLKPVAYIHTHGSSVDKNGEIKDFNHFSGHSDESMTPENLKAIRNSDNDITDIGLANSNGYLSYVVTPNGSLQKYDPQTGIITVISSNMPSDPFSPNRLNQSEPNISHDASLIKSILYQIILFFETINSLSTINYQ